MVVRKVIRTAKLCVLLSAIIIATTGCVTKRLYKVTAPSRWPPSRLSTPTSITVKPSVIIPHAYDNRIQYWCPQKRYRGFLSGMEDVIVDAYRNSKIFSQVTTEDNATSELTANVELRMVDHDNNLMVMLSAFTLGLMPFKTQEGYFELKTTVTTGSDSIIDVVKLTEKHQTRGFGGMFHSGRETLALEIVRDLARASVDKIAKTLDAENKENEKFF